MIFGNQKTRYRYWVFDPCGNSEKGGPYGVVSGFSHYKNFYIKALDELSLVLAPAVHGAYTMGEAYTADTTISEVTATWYSHIDPEKTVEIANYFREKAAAGETGTS